MDNRRGGRWVPAAVVLAMAGAVAVGIGTHAPGRKVVTAVAAAAPVRPTTPGTVSPPVPSTFPTSVAGTAPSAPPTELVTAPPSTRSGYPRRYGNGVAGGPVPALVRPAAVEAADPLAGLAPLPPGWEATAHTITVGSLERTYLTVAPQTLSGSVPVVVLMHGVDMDAVGILNLTELAAQTGPALILAPEGWQRSWDAGGCCGPAFRAGIDDVGFIRAAVAQVLSGNPDADPARVYAVGFSNGGRMAYRLACDLPGTFAGFLAAEAVPVEGCASLHPLNVTIVAQQADPLLSVAADQAPKSVDGSVEPTVAATIARQQALDGCAGDPSLAYDGVAEVRTWSCASGTRLTYVWYPGGAHTWRGPAGPTPGSTDMVLSLLGGQRLTDQAAAPAPVS